jgi:hypothetical protein
VRAAAITGKGLATRTFGEGKNPIGGIATEVASDYVIGRGMVTGQLSDGEIEGLLRGAPDVAGDLAEIAQVLNTLRGQGVPGPDADYIELYAAAARESRLTPLERFAMERVPAGRDLRTLVLQRAAMPIVALVMLVALTGGLAYAANGA